MVKYGHCPLVFLFYHRLQPLQPSFVRDLYAPLFDNIMAGAANAIGVLSGALTIFSFIDGEFPDASPPSTNFRFYVGYNGASPPNDPSAQLSGADGAKPDIRVWDEQGRFMGMKVNDGSMCIDGSIVCDSKVDGTRRSPTYSLFTANNDAICI